MTEIDARISKLERTANLQYLGLVALSLVIMVTWSAGAMRKTPLEPLKGKELLIEDDNGKTLAKLGGDGAGGVALLLSNGSEKGDRSIRLAVDNQSSMITTEFEGATTRAAASATGASTSLTTKDQSKIEASAGDVNTITLSHKDEKLPRISISSDPKMWPTIILRERDESIRWQSPKTGR